MIRIDAHHHLWDLSAVHYPWLMAKGEARFFGDPEPIQRDFLVDEFRAMATAQGFTASVHVQVGAADPLAEARWIQSVADANPGWPAAQVAFADLADPGRDALLDAYAELPTVRGVRQIVGRAPGEDAQTGTNALLENPAFLDGLRIAAARGLSFDLQLLPEHYAAMAALIERVPDLQVALCHAGSPYDRTPEGLADWAEKLKVLSRLPNVTAKLSGLGMFDHAWTVDSIRPIVETVMAQFGPDRVMFGSNFPVDSLTSSYSDLVIAYDRLIDAGDRDAVFGGTAARFYGLA